MLKPYRAYCIGIFTGALIFSLLLTGCSSVAKKEPGVAGTWQLVALEGLKISVAEGARAPVIRFDAAGARISGYAGCNNFSASFKHKDGMLRLGPIAATRRACSAPEEALERAMFGAMGYASAVRAGDGTLDLLHNERVLAHFKALERE
jgi:heat shock protein HslJ